MNIINITDYEEDDNNNMSLCNSSDHDNSILTIEISYSFLIISSIPCFLSLICCFSFLLFSFVNFFKKIKK